MGIDIRARIIAIKNAIYNTFVNDKLTTLFNDLPPVPFLTTKVGATAPTLTPFVGNIQLYTFGVNDESYGDTEVTHLYDEGTDLMPHIHWITNGTDTNSRYVKWEMEYSWSNDNSAFPTSTIISIEKEIPANTPTRTHFITDFPIISGVNMEIGAYLCWRVRRIASTGTAPTNDPFGLAVGVHAHENILQ